MRLRTRTLWLSACEDVNMETRPGATIGSYHLVRPVGSGGYAEAYLAESTDLTGKRRLAFVKIFRAHAGHIQDTLIRTLAREAELVARLAHPHIVSILDIGMDDGAVYVATSYLPAGSIESLVQSHDRSLRLSSAEDEGVSPAIVAPLVIQISQALRAAHDLGIAHGDLKPSNIFLHRPEGQSPVALVSDFGQSVFVQAALAGTRTPLPQSERSPLEQARFLAAPEQFNGSASPLSDQYTLAAVSCLLLTGLYPQHGAQPQRSAPSTALFGACASLLPPPAVPVLARALALDPAQRFGDITTFASELDHALTDAKAIPLALPHKRATAQKGAANKKDRPVVASVSAPSIVSGSSQAMPGATYTATGIAPLDTLLERVDRLTSGKAGLLQRAFTYVCIGGFAAVVNLITLYLVYNVAELPTSQNVHWLIGFIVAAEISTMTNFLLNDRITFSKLPGHARSWGARCLRFHSTSLAGTIATLVLSFAFKTWLGLNAIVAEAIAIVIALVLNFTMHHLWTYRHISEHKGAPASDRVAPLEAEGQARP